MAETWTSIALEQILIRSNDWIDIEPCQVYKQVTVKMWGKGIELRNEILGSEIAASKRLKVHPKQFILSRIDARHGAFGLIPDELEGAVVTNDFPVFNLNQELLLPEFLNWLSKTAGFVDICRAASEGTTNRIRLKEDRFLKTEIILPPIAEQRRIVARIEEVAAKIEEARGLRKRAIDEVEILLRTLPSCVFQDLISDSQTLPIGEIISFRSDLIRPGDGTIGELRFIGLQHIESHSGKRIGEDKLVAENLQGRKFRFSPGDIVYGYLRPYLNKVWVADCEGFCSVDQYVIRSHPDKADTNYLACFMRSQLFLNQAMDLTHNLLLPRLRTALLESIKIPLPSLSVQRKVVAHLSQIQRRIDQMKFHREVALKEFDALLPAILAKAFKGEL